MTRVLEIMSGEDNLKTDVLTGFDISQGTYSESKKANNEPVEDTFGDLANYSIIALIHRGGLWAK